MLMRSMLFSFSLLLQLLVTAQYNVWIDLKVKQAGTDTLFVAGNFNNWKPRDTGFALQKKQEGNYSIQLKNIPAGNYAFKFTRGSWEKVECTNEGKDIGNHEFTIISDTTLFFSVDAWKDNFGSKATIHTASGQVHLLDSAFVIPQLNRSRRVWIYLPKGYAQSTMRYPVMYIQDAQNIFDAATSFAGEWEIDETLDSLTQKGTRACIVVGIENGGDKRLNEYSPYDFELKGNGNSSIVVKGEGDAYVDFLANTLKPFIDKNYRTRKEKESTIVAGSSMGGLIAYYALVKYPQVFGEAGIFSPSFWIVPDLEKLLTESAQRINAKIFFYAGGKEDETMVNLMNRVADSLGKATTSIIYKVVDPEGQHNETAWRKWFPEFYQWIIGEGYDGKIKTD